MEEGCCPCLCAKRRKRIRTRRKVARARRLLLSSEDRTELCLDEEGLTDADVARLSQGSLVRLEQV